MRPMYKDLINKLNPIQINFVLIITCINFVLTDLAAVVITKAEPSSLEKSCLYRQVPGRFQYYSPYSLKPFFCRENPVLVWFSMRNQGLVA